MTDLDNWRPYRFLHRPPLHDDDSSGERAKPLSTLLQEEEENWKALVDALRGSLIEIKERSDQALAKEPTVLTPEEIEFGQKLMDEPDRQKGKAYPEDLKAWRE